MIETFHVALPSPVVPRFGPLWSLCSASVRVHVCVCVCVFPSVPPRTSVQYPCKCCEDRKMSREHVGVRRCVPFKRQSRRRPQVCVLCDQLSFTVTPSH